MVTVSVTDSTRSSPPDRPTGIRRRRAVRGDDPADRDPDAGGPQLPGPRRAGRVRGRPATRHRPGPRPGRAAGVRITHVFETHIHNDYVTGGLALARRDRRRLPRERRRPGRLRAHRVRDGDVIDVGPALRVRVLATPGHTFTHLSYALEEHGTATAVFSGGSLLFGSTGRPDLLGPDHTHDLVHHQYASAHRLAAELPDQTRVLPTHGFGSFCSATQSEATASTIGEEKPPTRR